VVGLEQTRELQRHELLGEDPGRGVLAEPPSRPHIDYIPDLVVVEDRVFGLEVHDHPADSRRQHLAFGAFG